MDGKKEDNGKLLNEEEREDGDSREEDGEFDWEGEREDSIANGPNNSLNFERLNSLFEFFEKLSILARSEIELSLFGRELPMSKEGWEKDPPLQRSDRSWMLQMVCKLIGGIDFIMEDMFKIFPEEEFKRFSNIFSGELFSSDLLNKPVELSVKLLKFKEDNNPCNIGTLSLSIASPVELVSSFRESIRLSESILKE